MEPGESSPTLLVGAGLRLSTLAQKQLTKFAQELSLKVAKGRVFTCLLAGDARLRRLNREYLGNDYATDVLSFPSSDASSLGDLAISVHRASKQSRQFGHSLVQEIQILMLHGVLHLLGFDHETDKGRMARAENKWRKALGLPNSLIERAQEAGA